MALLEKIDERVSSRCEDFDLQGGCMKSFIEIERFGCKSMVLK